MSLSRLARRICPAAIVLACAPLVTAQADRPQRIWDHGAHTQPSPEERALRELLGLYRAGDVESAVRGVFANPPHWIPEALDSTLHRIDEEITYHRRPGNRVGVARDERVERYLRADRLQVLLLGAALQLEASRAATAIDVIGSNVVDSERTIDKLYALRSDFEQNGPVPWPIAIDERWDNANADARESRLSADWPAVRSYVTRWYSAAIASLQRLVELRLVPALVARGLARFPGAPGLLLARGSFIETRLALSQVDASMASTLYSAEIRRRWRDELSDAERDFERAARAEGTASEAAVRLARVRLLTGQVERARETLGRVLAGDAPVELRYLALLFRAAAAEQAADMPAARRDYEAAANIVPGAQTPWLALGRIADEHDTPADAQKWVERALTVQPGAADPWRRYIQGQAWQLAARMASLRTLESR